MKHIILEGGQIIGILMRRTAEEWFRASIEPGLKQKYREQLRMLAELRKDAEGIGKTEMISRQKL